MLDAAIKIIFVKRVFHKLIVSFSKYISDFDGDGKPDNISFMIKRIKVHTNESLNDPKYRFPGNYGVEKFLEIFSGNFNIIQRNHL